MFHCNHNFFFVFFIVFLLFFFCFFLFFFFVFFIFFFIFYFFCFYLFIFFFFFVFLCLFCFFVNFFLFFFSFFCFFFCFFYCITLVLKYKNWSLIIKMLSQFHMYSNWVSLGNNTTHNIFFSFNFSNNCCLLFVVCYSRVLKLFIFSS